MQNYSNYVKIIRKYLTFKTFLNLITDFITPKSFPLIGIGFFFSISSNFLHGDYQQWMNQGTISYFLNPVVITGLSISVIICLLITYKKEWEGHWNWKRWYKVLHWVSFPAFALVASLTAYFGGIIVMFFGMINADAGNPLDFELHLVSMYFSILSVMTLGLFNSVLGKGMWFKMDPINKMPLKQYSVFEYKIQKHLPEKINKILFYN